MPPKVADFVNLAGVGHGDLGSLGTNAAVALSMSCDRETISALPVRLRKLLAILCRGGASRESLRQGGKPSAELEYLY
jgi:hypothetical protein